MLFCAFSGDRSQGSNHQWSSCLQICFSNFDIVMFSMWSFQGRMIILARLSGLSLLAEPRLAWKDVGEELLSISTVPLGQGGLGAPWSQP